MTDYQNELVMEHLDLVNWVIRTRISVPNRPLEQYESRGNLAAGKRTADQIILLKDYDPEIIRNFVERVRVYPSGEIEIDMRTSSGFAFVTAS